MKLPPGESFEGHTEFDGRQSIIINDNYPAMDILGTALEFRTEAYSEINSKFGFLWKILEKSVMKNEEIRKKCNQLLQIYNLSDLGHEFPDECVHLALHSVERSWL